MTDQPTRSAFAVLVLLAVTACNKTEKHPTPPEVQLIYDYELALPEKIQVSMGSRDRQ